MNMIAMPTRPAGRASGRGSAPGSSRRARSSARRRSAASGLQAERHRDHRALAHAAGELERIGRRAARPASGCRRGRAIAIARSRASPCSSGVMQRGSSRRSGRRSCGPATARSSAPGRSSRSRGRGSPRIARAVRVERGEVDGRRRRGRCKRISPPTMRPGGATICRIERAVIDLPQPDSPTTQSVLPRVDGRGRRRRRPSRRPRAVKKCVLQVLGSRGGCAVGHGRRSAANRGRPRRAGRRRGS